MRAGRGAAAGDGFNRPIVGCVRWEDGYVPSREPGLGITFDEDVARAHLCDADERHLGMASDEVVP